MGCSKGYRVEEYYTRHGRYDSKHMYTICNMIYIIDVNALINSLCDLY